MFIVYPSKKVLITKPSLVESVPLIGAKATKFKGRDIVAIPHDLANTAILTKFGLEPPEPINYYYKWSGHWKPFAHQVVTAAKMCTHPRFMCFSGMGSAKTMAALWASDYLLNEGVIDRIVVCSPLSTLESVWGDSLFEHFPHRSFSIAHGPKRVEAIDAPTEYLITNHHGVKTCFDELKKLKGRILWIVDEVATFRNSKTDLYKHLYKLCGPASGCMLWTLTGTPCPNSPTDIWAQARLINPDLVPKYFGRFREKVMTQINQYKWVPREGWERDVFKMMQPSVRYATDECIDLPDVTHSTRQVALSEGQTKAYLQVLKTSVAEAKEGSISAINEAAKILKLCQICTGLVYTDSHDVANLEPTARLKELMDVIEQSGQKCIVFVPFKHTLAWLHKKISAKYTTEYISGDVAASKRAGIFSAFQKGGLQVLLAHPKCMAHGINLTAGHTIVWWAPINDFEIYDQANARVRRPGQKCHQNIIHLTGTYTKKGKAIMTIEDRLYKRLKQKDKIQGLLLDLLKTKV